MPANDPLVSGQLYLYRVFCYQPQQMSVNVRYFKIGALTLAPTQLDLANALDAIAAPLYRALLNNRATYVGSDIQLLPAAGPKPIQVGTAANTGLGSAGAIPIPTQVAGIWTTQTDFVGPAFRGRSYIPFPATADTTTTDAPTPTGGYMTRLAALAAVYEGNTNVTVGGGKAAETEWCIYHRVPRTTTPIIFNRCNQLWATQRRRGDYGRPNPKPSP